MAATTQVNKVYAEVVTKTSAVSATQAQKVYAEVITKTSIAALSQVQKLYVEVITAAPGTGGATSPLILCCT